MSGFDQPQLPLDLPPLDLPSDPQIYIASALTHLDEEQTTKVRRWSTAVAEAVVDATLEDQPNWTVRVHQPVFFSHPQLDSRTPRELYDGNRRLVESAAAVIVLGYRGGSMGAGMELAWALGTRQPVLYVAAGDELTSRQVSGAPGIVTATFPEGDTAQLARLVARFVLDHRAAIEDHPRRLADRELLYDKPRLTMSAEFQSLAPKERRQAVVSSRIPARRYAELLNTPGSLAGATMDELSALTGSLGVQLGSLFEPMPPPDLTLAEIRVLETTAAEDAWSAHDVLEVMLVARAERARGGHRRLRFNTPDKWREIRDRMRRA